MKKAKHAVLLLIATMVMFICACGSHEAGCEIVSEEFVDSININQVKASWEGSRIVKIVLNVSFAEKFTSEDAKRGEDAYRKQISQKIVKGCSFTAGGNEIDITYFYWANQASGYYAQELTLFYAIPEDLELSDTTFRLDGAVLGDPAYQFSH